MTTTKPKRSPKPKGGLHFSRTTGTWIQIGTAIIYFDGIREGRYMDVTILAPPEIKVYRGELIERGISKLRGDDHEE